MMCDIEDRRSSLTDYDTKLRDLPTVHFDPKNLYELLYTFTNIYGVPDLSTESLVQVYEGISVGIHLTGQKPIINLTCSR
ncbi:hypothetical protein NPIL_575341 [Nephila pilipes]|uniref:Uncharacterized protein n=1 Tax=Nephila pilipes TaxID=299642 RepID=A0A8X6QKF7_NEPPI|nr:hypothetical protein NPIL_575341 [Nephila pilipes]